MNTPFFIIPLGAARAHFALLALMVVVTLLAITLITMNAAVAYAAEAAVEGGSIDLSALADFIIETLFGGILAILSWLAARAIRIFTDKTGVEIDAHTRQYLYEAIYNGISYARGKLDDLAHDKLSDIEIKNATIAGAVSYVSAKVPDALARFGIDEDALKDLVEARLGGGLISGGIEVIEGSAATLSSGSN